METHFKISKDKFGYKIKQELIIKTNKLIRQTIYRFGDETIDYVEEYDLQTNRKIKKTNYKSDGKTIEFIAEFDPQTEEPIKTIVFNLDYTINFIYDHSIKSERQPTQEEIEKYEKEYQKYKQD